jgi:hypothetical protein
LAANRVYEADSILSRVDTLRGVGPGLWLARAAAARLIGDHDRELAMNDAAMRHARGGRSTVLGFRVRALSSLGRFDEVRAIADSVARLPSERGRSEILGATIGGLLAAGRADDARTVASVAVPHFAQGDEPFDADPSRATLLIAGLEFAGRHADAVRTGDSVVAVLAAFPEFRLTPGLENDFSIWPLALLGAVHARGGDTSRADAIDRRLEALKPIGIARPAALVGGPAIAAQRGRRYAAVARLREAIEAGATFRFSSPGSVLYLNSGIAPDSPWLSPLRGYAPFEALIRPVR